MMTVVMTLPVLVLHLSRPDFLDIISRPVLHHGRRLHIDWPRTDVDGLWLHIHDRWRGDDLRCGVGRADADRPVHIRIAGERKRCNDGKSSSGKKSKASNAEGVFHDFLLDVLLHIKRQTRRD